MLPRPRSGAIRRLMGSRYSRANRARLDARWESDHDRMALRWESSHRPTRGCRRSFSRGLPGERMARRPAARDQSSSGSRPVRSPTRARRGPRGRRRRARSRTRRGSRGCARAIDAFGITTLPSCTCQRSTICAGLRPCFAAMRVEQRRREHAAPGERRPRLGDGCRWARRRTRAAPACGSHGCSSTWFTTGVTPVSAMSRSRWCTWKFETPIDAPAPRRAGG